MEKKLGEDIFRNISEYGEDITNNYNIKILERYEYENKFHQWVDGKDILGIINISNKDTSYYFVFIDWKEDNNYYIVLLSSNKVNTLVELHKVEKEYNSINLEWRYKPSKRDNQNEERKGCFKKYYGDIIKRIEVPKNVDDVEGFLDDIFDLIGKRIKSDNIDFEEREIMVFPEGRVSERVHKKRERNSKLISIVKQESLERDKKLTCQICGFDFYKVYGKLGDGFIEAHHTIPVSQLNENSETKKEDIVLVCSNCHSMLHRKRPWATIEEMKKLLK